MSMPSWLTEHIETTTGARPGAATARTHRCHNCHAIVLTGLDMHPHGAFEATVDPTPLTSQGEAVALLTGRRTYELTMAGDRTRLWRRGQHAIRARPADPATPGNFRYDIYPAHRHGTRFTGPALTTRSAFAPARWSLTSTCPF